jgi:glucose/arabinose dehydrogenase
MSHSGVAATVLSAALWIISHGVAHGQDNAVNLRDFADRPPVDLVAQLYEKECAVCHGESLQGAAQGPPLVGTPLSHGASLEELAHSTRAGFPDRGMPGWAPVLSSDQIHALALFIAERRAGTDITDFRYSAPLRIPEEPWASEHYRLAIDTIIAGLAPLPFSIAPLPDGRILLTEKMRGLSIVSATGDQSPLIQGTPTAFADAFTFGGQPMGLGWLMDVAPHPDYPRNGWIYLHYGDRCAACNAAIRQPDQPVSMNKVVRGRIENGAWIDQETIWEADPATYTTMPEIAAGGRLSFDNQGFIYISIGIKGPAEHIGIQDLGQPYGKVLRLHDDGRIPQDNPFNGRPQTLPEIWTYGHRNPQGLEFDATTLRLWESEMGPRGGDELNILRAGRNYGWPLRSRGVAYDGTPIAFAEQLGIDLGATPIEEPVMDLTPSPAISSFVVYRGSMFPAWNGHIVAGTLRASDLLRLAVNGEAVTRAETLLEDIARIRDVEVDASGAVLVLLEHDTGGAILRMRRDE